MMQLLFWGIQGIAQKFGFVPAVKYGIKSEYDVPGDVFMIVGLAKDSLKNHHGVIKYYGIFSSK